MSKQEEIIEVAGKKVVVRYIEHLSPCPPCVFYEEGCTCSEYCRNFDRGGEIAYFVLAEKSVEDKILPKLREFLANATPEELEAKYCELEHLLSPADVEIVPDKMEVGFEEEYKRYMSFRKDDVSGHAVTINLKDFARHFAEWERKRILDKVVEWMKKNLIYEHPRKGDETCMVNISAFLDAMNE